MFYKYAALEKALHSKKKKHQQKTVAALHLARQHNSNHMPCNWFSHKEYPPVLAVFHKELLNQRSPHEEIHNMDLHCIV